VPLKNVTTRFAMERVKSTTALPLEILPDHHKQGSAKSALREASGKQGAETISSAREALRYFLLPSLVL
jgi:hypothetical protein